MFVRNFQLGKQLGVASGLLGHREKASSRFGK